MSDDCPLPPEFDAAIYRELHPDLRNLSDDELQSHYQASGMSEGRQCNIISDRKAFISLIPQDASILEIGPFANPLAIGPKVKYFDVLTTKQLQDRAASLGLEVARVPQVNYVSATADLSIVKDEFDVVISSHAIEHQPDLIRHLQQVEKLLVRGGRYFLLVPDKRYTFDHFIAESQIAAIVEAHMQGHKAHSLRSVIENHALQTHNDPGRHWRGDHGEFRSEVPARVRAALDEYEKAEGGYLDVHAWYFTPSSFRGIMCDVKNMGYFNMEVERVYSTRRGSNEFWSVLKADDAILLGAPIEDDPRWHERELLNAMISFRWTSSPEIAWPPHRFLAGKNKIRLRYLMEIAPGFARKCQVFLGAEELPTEVIGDCITATATLPEDLTAAIRLVTPPPRIPREWGKPDSRSLGLAVPITESSRSAAVIDRAVIPP